MKSIYVFVIRRNQYNSTTKKTETFEEAHVEASLKPKLLESADFILDLVNEEVVKNRHAYELDAEGNPAYTYESVLAYLVKHHQNVSDVLTRMREFEEQLSNAAKELETKLAELDSEQSVTQVESEDKQ